MGLFWDLFQQSQISKHTEQASVIEVRVARLESELVRTQGVVHELIKRLEERLGQDVDGDGRVG